MIPFESRKAVMSQVMEGLRSASGLVIILITGLPGVGKTTLVEAISEEVRRLSASVVEGDVFRKLMAKPDRSYVVPAGSSAAKAIREGYPTSRFASHRLVEIELQPLAPSEILTYLESHGFTGHLAELAVSYSQGVPRAARMICESGAVDEQMARAIAWRALPGVVARDESAVGILAGIAVKRLEFQSKAYEPVAFRTEEASLAIYDRMLSMPHEEMKSDGLQVLVPNVSEHLVNRLKCEVEGLKNSSNSNWDRIRALFGSVWNGSVIHVPSPTSIEWAPSLSIHGFRLVDSPLRAVISESSYPFAWVYTRQHDIHCGVLVGAMGIETLLQQLQVGYLVGYDMIGEIYRYDPPDSLHRIE
jgi:hypothetical protein